MIELEIKQAMIGKSTMEYSFLEKEYRQAASILKYAHKKNSPGAMVY